MPAEVLVALVPTARSTPEAAAETVQSILGDAKGLVSVVACGEDRSLQIEGVEHMDATAILDAAPILGFARPGDSWREGAFEARLRTFAAHPTARLSVAGHALVAPDGTEVLTVRAPTPPLDPAELLVRRAEPSAVLARSVVLDPVALELLARPHGDAVVWNRIAQEHGLLPSGETAADVPLDPDRHGYAPEATTAALHAMLTASGWIDGTSGSTLRRELLRRCYLEARSDPDKPIDLVCLLPESDERSSTLIGDLRWTLERQRDALAAERVGWPESLASLFEDECEVELVDDVIDNLRRDVEWLHTEVALRDATIRHLHAEVALRDATIRQARDDAPGRDERSPGIRRGGRSRRSYA